MNIPSEIGPSSGPIGNTLLPATRNFSGQAASIQKAFAGSVNAGLGQAGQTFKGVIKAIGLQGSLLTNIQSAAVSIAAGGEALAKNMNPSFGISFVNGFSFSMMALIQKKGSFQDLVKEISNIWSLCNFKERFSLLADAFFKFFEINSLALQTGSTIGCFLGYTALAIPAVFFMSICSLIFSIQSLLKMIATEKIRQSFLSEIDQAKTPEERLKKTLTFYTVREKDVEENLRSQKNHFERIGADPALINQFIALKKSWQLTAIYGKNLHKTAYTQFARMKTELDECKDSTRKDAIIREGNELIDDFLITLKTNSIQMGAVLFNELLTSACAIIASVSLAMFLPHATIIVLSITGAIITISLCIAAYNLWQNQKTTPQEKETIIDLVTDYFLKDPQCSHLLGFNAEGNPQETAFRDHLKTALHQKDILKKINRQLFKKAEEVLKKRSISPENQEKFQKSLRVFFKSIPQKTATSPNALLDTSENLSLLIAEGFFKFLQEKCPLSIPSSVESTAP